MHKRGVIVLALGGVCAAAQGQEDAPAPDLEFLEYLGSWQGGDEEWLAVAEWEKDEPPPRAERGGEDGDAPKRAEPERRRNDDDAP